jgi:ferritin
MPINDKIGQALKDHLDLESTNALVYESLAAGLHFRSWPGAAAYMEKCAAEERDHARKVRDFLVARQVQPVWGAIEAPPMITSEDMLPYFNAALAREQMTTMAITMRHMEAWNAVDLETCNLYVGMIQEQTESTGRLQAIIDQLRRNESDPMLIDQALGRG